MEIVIDQVLRGIERCPHCGVASPEMSSLFKSPLVRIPSSAFGHIWAVYLCNTCRLAVLAQTHFGSEKTHSVQAVYPSVYVPDEDLPLAVRVYIKQAAESLHAPDGAAMLAGAAVDAMLKARGYKEGSVYSRIDEAFAANILTADMAEWAHEVRLGSNRPRHADENSAHLTLEEARRAVDFAKMLGHILFVLPARVRQRVT